MIYESREQVLKALQSTFVESDSEWCDLAMSTTGNFSITLVSQAFEGLGQPERRKRVREIVESRSPGAALAFLSLYSPQEAGFIELERPDERPPDVVATWHELAHLAANGQSRAPRAPSPELPRTIAFYSFKGGVGRTTALIHVAAILARRGRKVVAVDLDLEAPGLGAIVERRFSDLGMIDYLYERVFMPRDTEPKIHVGDLLNEVEFPGSSGRLFVVPAGQLDLDYISKVDEMRTVATSQAMYCAWQRFVAELTDHIKPDLILVDSRTGINEWGALSTFRAADETIVFLFPSEQNAAGITLILQAFTKVGLPPVHVVFSPVPEADKAGLEMVQKFWSRLQNEWSIAGDEEGDEIDEPLIIPYLQGIALSDVHPVERFVSHYDKLANLIDSESTSIKASQAFVTADRWKILESLSFPYGDATDPRHQLDEFFQKTADFDHFLDQATCLIRGRKGTGKSALYWLFLGHFDGAKKLAPERLNHVRCVSGHGRYRPRPSRDEFRSIARELKSRSSTWEPAWRGYLLMRLRLEKELPSLRGEKFEPLRQVLKKCPRGDQWQIEHTRTLLELSTEDRLILLAKDALDLVDGKLKEQDEMLWVLYDDLDEDLANLERERFNALAGLFQFLQSSDAKRHSSLKFKVFIREDLWAKTVFDNRSHFNGRDLLLQWTRIDFLRLSLRLARRSAEFQQLISRLAPVEDVDNADEQSLDNALQILWGSRRESNKRSKYVSRWIYEILTDSSGTTFPRSLSELLKAAHEHELTYESTKVQAPGDRLLRAKSLNQGLEAASHQRSAEIREEHPELGDFFDQLRNKYIFLELEELRELWEATTREAEPSFDDFVEKIEKIGLASWREKEERFRFADIYSFGFSMNRGKAKP